MAWSSFSLPTVVGEHIVATDHGLSYRIACAGSGRWTVTVHGDIGTVYATLELNGSTYRYVTTGVRSSSEGPDWRKLLLAEW